MDESAQVLSEAFECLGQMQPISLTDMVFEKSADAKEISEKNDSLVKKSINAIKKAITAIIDALKKLVNKFSEGVSKLFTGKKKDEYKKACEAIRKNPELAKQVVEVETFGPYEKIYDKAIKELDDEMKKEDPDPQKIPKIMEAVQAELNGLKDDAGSVGKRVAVATSLKALTEMANKNATAARLLNMSIRREVINLEGAREVLGDKAVARYEKKIRKYARNGVFHRAKAKLLHYKEQTLLDVMNQQYNTLLHFTNAGKIKEGRAPITRVSVAKGAVRHPFMAKDILKGTGDGQDTENIVDLSRASKQAVKDAAKFKNDASKDMKSISKFLGVDKKK